MDAFEQVVAEILWREGYWVRTSFKVELTKEEKRLIGRASTPRWEIDVVAFNAQRNEIKAIECKSYMDSRGVKFIGFDPSSSESSRYKLFNDNNLREIVFGRLRTQLAEKGMCTPTTIVKLCLACGRVASSDDREYGIILRNVAGSFGMKNGYGHDCMQCLGMDMKIKYLR